MLRILKLFYSTYFIITEKNFSVQSRSIIDLDLPLFHQNTRLLNFLLLHVTKLRQITSYDALEMIERKYIAIHNYEIALLIQKVFLMLPSYFKSKFYQM